MSLDVGAMGQYIRHRRLEKKVGTRELARKIGVSPGYISHIEKGKIKQPSSAFLANMFIELNIDHEQRSLFGLTDEQVNGDKGKKAKEMQGIYRENMIKRINSMEFEQIENLYIMLENHPGIMQKIKEIEKKSDKSGMVMNAIEEHIGYLHDKYVVNRLTRLFEN